MDPLEIPEYLVAKNIRQLIMVSGLNVNNNPVHKSIFSSFLNLKKINYKLLPADFEFATKSEKKQLRNSNGILKRDWPLKYINTRPALIVLFVDLNWNHPEWNQKRMECESKIASLRHNLNCRETRIVLVLIQAKTSPVDDQQVKERATELCSSLQLSEKQLFVFPQNEKHENVATRLDGLFYEFSQQFYQSILRKIRSRSIPNNYSNLLIRQQFKLAFISELRQDTHSALRIYKQAYQNGAEADVPDAEFFEYLSVLSLLNYKICELSFQHNIVNDAVSQFRKHMALFLKRSGGQYPSQQLAQIEILKWKSKQCQTFGFLFLDAVNNGLVAFVYENPGLYFEKSGDFLRQSNELILSLKSSRETEQMKSINKDILLWPEVTHDTVIYYGQRPWRVKSGLGTLDPLTEHAAKLALEDACAPDSKTTIQLWSLSIRQYQIYSCNRMLAEVRLKISEECFYLREFSTSLNSIQLVISKLHKEKAALLLQKALLRLLEISFCQVNINDYFWSLTQLLNPSVLSQARHQDSMSDFLVNNYNAILNSTTPMPTPSLNKYFSASELTAIKEQWNQALTKPVEVITNFSSIEGHLQITGAFLIGSKRKIYSGDNVFVQVSIQNFSSLDLPFVRCKLNIEEHGMSRSMSASQNALVLTRENINVGAKSIVNLVFSTQLILSMPARQEASFYIKQIQLDFTSLNRQLNGVFKFDKIDFSHQQKSAELSAETSSVCVFPLVPKIELKQLSEPTILMDEIANLQFVLKNNESFALQKISVTARQLDTDDDQPENYEFPSLDFEVSNSWQPRQTYEITSELASGSEIVFNISCKARCQFKSQLQLQVSASVPNNTSGWFGDLIDHSFNFPMAGQLPFSVQTRLLADNDEPIQFLLQGHRSFLECNLQPNFSGEFHGLQFELSPEFTAENPNIKSTNYTETLTYGQIITERLLFRVTSKHSSSEFFSLGNAVISWKRATSREITRTTLNLDKYPFRTVPLLVVPNVNNNSLFTRQPIKIDYLIKNLTNEVVEIRIGVERNDNENLMFDGFAQKKIVLLPKKEYNLILTVVTTKPGNVPYPRLKIECNDKQLDEQIQSLTLRYVRSSVFVTPSAKEPTPMRSIAGTDDERSSCSRGSSVV